MPATRTLRDRPDMASTRRPETRRRAHAAGARRVEARPNPRSGAITAAVALFFAAALAAVSVALATRSFWGGDSGPTGAMEKVPQGASLAPGQAEAGGAPGAAGSSGTGPGASRSAAHPPLIPPPPFAPPDDAAKLRLPEAPKIPAERRVYLFEDGKAQVVRDDDARLSGYTLIDLSDDWVPYLFKERSAGRDDFKKNQYRETFVKVANDLTDEAGKPLGKGEHNYVELYGIPPSLSVVRSRFLEDEARDCYEQLRPAVLEGYRGAVKYEGGSKSDRILERYRELKRQVRKAMRRTGAQHVNQLKRRGEAFLAKRYRLFQTKLAVINQAQRRLECEGLYQDGERVRRMHFDHDTHQALARFERKHMLYGWGQLYGKTLRTLARPPLQNNFATFKRVITERVVHSVGILEDGSAPLKDDHDVPRARRGKLKRGPDLVSRYTSRVLQAMDLDTPDKVLRFFLRHPPEVFKHLRVGVKLPPRPDYYQPTMRFEVVIDRGDVWYDPPVRADGTRRSFPRHYRPTLTLYARKGEKRVPLVRYHTTIGGWRKEYKDGKEYYAYKGSEVGPRIWRDIVAGPVWIPPATTPPKSLVTAERKGGKWIRRLNREEIGPSYASAYGLVAAYHIEEAKRGEKVVWKDNGIRTHGSVDYMSILTRYSHGCHRMHNHKAVRLFSFILRHSKFVRRGQVPLAYARSFTVRGQRYRIELDTRGYYYTLRRPVRVMVTEGRIRGKRKTPIEHFVAIPGKTYDPDDPNLRPEAKVVQSEAKDSKDGYQVTGDLPPEKQPEAGKKGEGNGDEGDGQGDAKDGEGFLQRFRSLDPSQLPPPPMKP